MNTEKLSSRLHLVAECIPKGFKLADIGSDHAYLPCYVVKKGLVPFAIAGEVVEGPYQSAMRQVQSENLTEQISVRKGDGLEVIAPGEVDCITIAGMGGALIASILDDGKDKLVGVKRLVLQPNISAISIRQWFIHNNWEIIHEEIIEEDEKIYEILVAENGDPLRPFGNEIEKGLLFGPILMKQKTEVFHKKWLDERKNWKKILNQLVAAKQSAEIEQKIAELKGKIRMVEEVLGVEESEWL